jgi:hypothetical protein
MTVAIEQGNSVALGEGIQVRVAQLVALIAREFGVFDGRVSASSLRAGGSINIDLERLRPEAQGWGTVPGEAHRMPPDIRR